MKHLKSVLGQCTWNGCDEKRVVSVEIYVVGPFQRCVIACGE